MRGDVLIKHVDASGKEDQLYAVTAFRLSENISDPLTTASITFAPLVGDFEKYREKTQRGEVLRFYLKIDGREVLQCTLLVESTTTTLSVSGGFRIDAKCVHPIKVLYEGQLNNTYEKLFKDKLYTMAQLTVDVVSEFFFKKPLATDPEISTETFSIGNIPIFEPDDMYEGWQRIGKNPRKNEPDSDPTNWAKANITEVRAQNHETAYAFLARQATRFGLIIRPAANGAVMLTKPRDDLSPDYTIGTHYDQGITAMCMGDVTEEWTNEGQPSEVNVRGQTRGGAASKAALPGQAKAVITKPKTARGTAFANETVRYGFRSGSWYPHKPLYIVDKDAPDQRRAENTAKLVIGLHAKDSYRLRINLDGCGDTDTIYAINRVAHIIIPELGLSEPFLITRRDFSVDASAGQVTSLELIPKGAFILGEAPSS